MHEKTHSKLVVSNNWLIEVNYMCDALNEPYQTMLPAYERRTWVMQREDTTRRADFIYLPNSPEEIVKNTPPDIRYTRIYEEPPAYLIKTNGRKVLDILKEMKVPVREH